MKVLQRMIERLIRQRVEIDEIQCGFMSGGGTTNAIFIVYQLQNKQLTAKKPVYMAFVVGNAQDWNRQVVGAPGPVHVQVCRKQG